MKRRELLLACGAVAVAGRASAAEDVVVGSVYPLTGNGAQVGLDAKVAIELAVEIFNTAHAGIPMLGGKGGGLDRIGGAKIRLVFADSQGDPQKARAEAERLITQDKAVAIIGSYTSATAATISQVTERYEVPYISADNSSPSLHQRGLKWFFRTGPHDEMFTAAMFAFFKDIAAKTGKPVKSVALFYEDSIFGTDSSTVQRKLAAAAGVTVAADIRYRSNSPSLSSEAQKLKSANADVLMPSSYTSDSILILRAMNEIGYKPRAIMAQAAGFQEQSFLTGAGALAEGAMSRSSFALDADPQARPAIAPVNAMYKTKNNKDMNDNTSREFTAMMVLADAINRSGSGKPAELQTALQATDIKGDQTIMPWDGIKFDETGQNTLCNPVIQQVFDGVYKTIWPFALATKECVWGVG